MTESVAVNSVIYHEFFYFMSTYGAAGCVQIYTVYMLQSYLKFSISPLPIPSATI